MSPESRVLLNKLNKAEQSQQAYMYLAI